MDTDEITGAWDYSTLPANVFIGPDCWIERRASFERYRSTQNPGLVLGHRVKAFTWTEFNVEPTGTLEVGDDTVLVGAVFMCAERIQIGRAVVISYNVTVADSDFHPLDPRQRRRDAVANSPSGDRSQRPEIEARPVTVGDGAWIGIGAIILKGVTIGEDARVRAGSIVVHDVPGGATVGGNPAVVETDN
jgi:acetyltransferase-like isoleucine patch superfamily enzyme